MGKQPESPRRVLLSVAREMNRASRDTKGLDIRFLLRGWAGHINDVALGMAEAGEEGKAEPRPGDLRSIEQAARALSAKLQEIHKDPRYEAVWTIAHVHGQTYTGPTYEAELEALRGALARIELDRTADSQAPTAQSAPPPAGPAKQDKDLDPSASPRDASRLEDRA